MLILNRFIKVLITFIFILLIFLVTIKVMYRVLGFSAPWAMELAKYTFSWLVFTGGYFTIQKGINITFDLIIDALPTNIWKFVFTLTNLISCIFLVVTGILSIDLINNMNSVSPVLIMPMHFVVLAIQIERAHVST